MTTRKGPAPEDRPSSNSISTGNPTPQYVKPIGDQFPSAEVSFVGSLLWAAPEIVRAVFENVEVDDVGDPFLRELVGVVRTLAAGGRSGAAAVSDHLLAAGLLAGDRGNLLAKKLADATTCGADPLEVRNLATAVVAQSYRRRFSALSEGLGKSDELPERDLLGYLRGHGTVIAAHEARLSKLRGGVL